MQSELSLCLLELDAIVTVCVQSANGEEPNVLCLLGFPRKSLDTVGDLGDNIGTKKHSTSVMHTVLIYPGLSRNLEFVECCDMVDRV